MTLDDDLDPADVAWWDATVRSLEFQQGAAELKARALAGERLTMQDIADALCIPLWAAEQGYRITVGEIDALRAARGTLQ